VRRSGWGSRDGHFTDPIEAVVPEPTTDEFSEALEEKLERCLLSNEVIMKSDLGVDAREKRY